MIYQRVKCTVCKKTTKLTINKYGLTSFGRCTLTNNCRGVLLNTVVPDITSDYNQDKPNWVKANILYDHVQYTLSNNWVINHNLNNYPIVNVFVDTTNGLVEQRSNFVLTYNSINTLTINFDNNTTGKVQCIARDSYTKDIESAVDIETVVSVSYYSNITLAIKPGITFTLIGTDIYGNNYPINNISLQSLTSLSPWYGRNTITYNNQLYYLYEINLKEFIYVNNVINQTSIYVESVYNNGNIVTDIIDSDVLLLLNENGVPTLNQAIKFFKFKADTKDTNIIMDNKMFAVSNYIETIQIS